MHTTIIYNATIYDGSGSAPYDHGAVAFRDGRIIYQGSSDHTRARYPEAIAIDAQGAPLCPGYIDIHHHGGAGAAYDEGYEAATIALQAHRHHGSTRAVLSLVTASVEELKARIQALLPLIEQDPSVLGIHAEGPFLDPAHKGAHPEHLLRDPDPTIISDIIDAAQGSLIQMTLAPERKGGLESIALLNSRGVHVAVGHTNADYDQAQAAFEAGADILTHAFNGMNGIHHRAPGPVIAALRNSNAWLEVINDTIHVHPMVVRSLFLEAPERVVLVTDAMSATCNPDGDYMLGELPVTVKNGIATLAHGHSLAGSTLTMDKAVANAVKEVGVPLELAIAAATSHPAQAIGMGDRYGRIKEGYPADILLLDPDSLLPKRIWADGHEVL